MTENDIQRAQERFTKQYSLYGKDPRTLDWNKGKQDLRFDILTSQCDFSNEISILDIGCGFGDLNKTLSIKAEKYFYVGIDIVDVLINEAKSAYRDSESTEFICGNFLSHTFSKLFDWSIASGPFNYKLEADNYEFITASIAKALSLSKVGIAFDFLSDRVDYQYEHTFHSNPSKILEIAYSFSRNVILRNDYMPFEFTLFIFKDDSFDSSNTIFRRYMKYFECN